MQYSFFDFFTLIGSLGLFLYGMKVMSEGLQKAAGDKMRRILTAMTTNRFTGVLTGVLITALIQSSSATTVMVVSFVNAGLLTLSQSITVIMGANVGTTVTAWIISLLGFKVSISALSIPLIGISIPFIFSGKSKRRYWGEFIVGFAFLFMGLDFLKNSVPDIQNNPQILNFLAEYTNMGYWSVFLFLAVGTILTIIVQSSSATMAITLIMCSEGWISFEIAAAMVLGENIGTTITANLAALSGNVSAKRAAFAHLMFNVFGVIWMMALFFPFTRMISYIVTNYMGGDPHALSNFVNTADPAIVTQIMDGKIDPTNTAMVAMSTRFTSMQVAVSFALSLFHSVFNILNVLIMIWFVKGYVFIVSKVIRTKVSEDEFQLKFISSGLLSTSELSLLQVKKEMVLYARRSQRMFGLVEDYFASKEGSEEYSKLYNRIEKYERISDRMEIEIANYLNSVADGRLSSEGKFKVRAMLTVVTEIESIGDSCFHIARTLVRKQDAAVKFNAEIEENIQRMFKLTREALSIMTDILENNDITESEIVAAFNKEAEINNLRNELRSANIENINMKKYDYQSGIYFIDIITESEKLADYIVNVVDALKEKRYLDKK